MVFDAGSSHTSLFVYEWDSDKENDTGVVSQTLSCDVQGQYPPAMSCPVPVLGRVTWLDSPVPRAGTVGTGELWLWQGVPEPQGHQHRVAPMLWGD